MNGRCWQAGVSEHRYRKKLIVSKNIVVPSHSHSETSLCGVCESCKNDRFLQHLMMKASV